MPERTNGGVFRDQVLTGSLRHFRIVGADFSGAIDGTGQPIHNSAAEIIFTELSQKATLVIMNPITNCLGISLALETNRADWTAAEMEVVINALGTIGVDGVDVSGVVVEEVFYDLIGSGTPGASDFLGLSDTPADYTGFANHKLVVNPTEDGIIFIPDTGGGSSTFIALTDTPSTYIGQAGRVPIVNAGETALEFTDATPLQTAIINGQETPVFEDTVRSKTLSIAENSVVYTDNVLRNLEWIRIGNSRDALSGYVAEFDGTITHATGHCANVNNNDKDIHLYINGLDTGNIGTLTGNVNSTFINTTIDINFNQGDIIRLRAQDGTPGRIDDTVIKLTFKWRA
jgi:hypothetical protein